VLALDEPLVADRESMALDDPEGALAGDRLERLRLRRLEPTPLGFSHDRLRERVLALALHRSREPQQVALVDTVLRDDGHDLRLTLRQRPRLVENDRVECRDLLERIRVLEQDPAACAEPGPDHDRRRRREPERIRARDHDDRDRVEKRVGDGLAEREPDEERHEPAHERDEHQP
jgi:hypothetical protein